MRNKFATTLVSCAHEDPRICLLTGDLGYSALEPFIEAFPNRFLNVGVAEQNLTGLAAGMALEGYVPIIYSIIPFVTMRNFEQVRNDICYQNVNVKIVGPAAGFSYGPYGHTHHALEDIGVMRVLPNMTILAPGDPVEVELATRAMLSHIGPCYMRLGKAGEPNVHIKKPKFAIGKAIEVIKGKDVALIATSTLLNYGFLAAQILAKNGIHVRLISMHTVKPIDEKTILECAHTKAVCTLEEHSIIGGLGSAVAEVMAEHGTKTKLIRLGVPDRFTKTIGKQEHMRKANGLTVEQIVNTITKVVHAIQK